MRTLLHLAALAAALAAALVAAHAARAATVEASAWSQVKGAAVRLIPGPAEGGRRLAGLDIRLDEGWKTYWRYPGEAGVPPAFDWSASGNVASVEVAWPAPHRFIDADSATIGYKDEVVLPLAVTARDPARPVMLVLALDYAICKDICVPAKGGAALTLAPGDEPAAGDAARIAQAQASVPATALLGASGAPAIRSAALDTAAKPAVLTLETGASPQADLFVEGPEDWYLPLPQRVPGTNRFTLALDGLPRSATLAGTALRLTLVDGDRAVETSYTLPQQ